jgi:hypothetical protein
MLTWTRCRFCRHKGGAAGGSDGTDLYRLGFAIPIYDLNDLRKFTDNAMANTDAFAIQRSDLNGFLFADVGTEANGMTLSVLSTLARLGMDPWDEAGRLARQPKAKAIEGLARMIANVPSGLWPLPDATPIAARLVTLLPTRGGGGGGEAAAQTPTAHVSTIGKSLLERLPLAGKGAGPKNAVTKGGPSAFVLVLLAGLLAGLTLYLLAQRASADQIQGTNTQETQSAKPNGLTHPTRPRPTDTRDPAPDPINKGA